MGNVRDRTCFLDLLTSITSACSKDCFGLFRYAPIKKFQIGRTGPLAEFIHIDL